MKCLLFGRTPVQSKANRSVPMLFTGPAVERAMKVQEVLLRALSGALTWIQAAEILGIHTRSLRRWRARYEAGGVLGLYDRRRGRPSRRKAPIAEVQHVLRLYRDRYGPRDGHPGFNVRHFHHLARRDHGVKLSYSFVKLALQEAGLVRKGRTRGRHRRRREPRPCFGELLHLDGSRHAWLALRPAEQQTLIAVLDDATKRLLYAQLAPTESTEAVMRALQEVFQTHGLPIALYTDRAGWAFYTPRAGGNVDLSRPTQVGRALGRLGIEHIPSYSPQARGRGERLNRTLQDRLINELRLAGCTTIEAANAYLREHFIADYDAQFSHPPAEAPSAFVPHGAADLEQILCHEEDRTVGQDNVVVLGRVALQLAKQPGRRTCAGLRVTVRRHLDGRHSVWRGTQYLGAYDAAGRPLPRPAGGYQPSGPLPQRRSTRLLPARPPGRRPARAALGPPTTPSRPSQSRRRLAS
jgi:transposase